MALADGEAGGRGRDHQVVSAFPHLGETRRQRSAGTVASGRAARAVVCVVGALAACVAIASLADGQTRDGDMLVAGPTRREMLAELQGRRPRRASEGAMIKEEASEDTNTREKVAMQAETMRSALRAMSKESSPTARLELDRAETMLRTGAESGSAAGLAALQGARAVLSQVIGSEAAQDRAQMEEGSTTGSARMQSLTSQELSVPDSHRAWRERYMERYATCWPHCALV